MRSFPKAFVLAVALTALSGCQSFPLTSWMFKRSDRANAEMAQSSGMDSLAEGREALQEGRPAAAIMPLRMALLDSETRPQASNALGVAYAQMGREDLAEQHFKAAIAADPSDTRFVANLLRLQNGVLARKAQSDAAQLAMQTTGNANGAEGFVADSPVPRTDSACLAGYIERTSRGEVFVASANAPSAPSAKVAYRSPAKGGKAPAPVASAPAPVSAPVAAPPKALIVDNPVGVPPSAPVAAQDLP